MPKKKIILWALSMAAVIGGFFQPSIASALTVIPVSAASFAASSDQAGGFFSPHSHDVFGRPGLYPTPALEVGGGLVETTSGNQTSVSGEEARGMVEYDLGNLTSASLGSVVLSFRLGGEGLAEDRSGEIFSQQTQYDNLIDVQGYVGDGVVETSDFDSGYFASAGQVLVPVGATTSDGFSDPPYVAPGFPPFVDGDIFQIDVTGMVGQLLLDGHQFLGIRFDSLTDYASCGGANCASTHGHVLYDVRLQVSIPEPGMLVILGLGLMGIGFTRRKRMV